MGWACQSAHLVQAAEWQLEEARFAQERQKREKAVADGRTVYDSQKRSEGYRVVTTLLRIWEREHCNLHLSGCSTWLYIEYGVLPWRCIRNLQEDKRWNEEQERAKKFNTFRTASPRSYCFWEREGERAMKQHSDKRKGWVRFEPSNFECYSMSRAHHHTRRSVSFYHCLCRQVLAQPGMFVRRLSMHRVFPSWIHRKSWRLESPAGMRPDKDEQSR